MLWIALIIDGDVLLFVRSSVPLFVCLSSETLTCRALRTGLTNPAVLAAVSGRSATGPVRPVPSIGLHQYHGRHSTAGLACKVRSTEWCHFEWPWVILSELAKYSMTCSIARPLCVSWASCLPSSAYQLCPKKVVHQTHGDNFVDS